jgi:hypothetical protein
MEHTVTALILLESVIWRFSMLPAVLRERWHTLLAPAKQ